MKIKHSIGSFILQKVLKRYSYRNTFLCLFLGTALNLSAGTIFEQKFTLNLSFKNAKIEQVLDAISKQSGIKIAYSNSEVTTNKNVSVNIQTSDIEEALLAILGDGYTFKQIDDYIAIAKNENTQKANRLTVVQQKKQSVSGLLTDADGNPVIGATVSIKGTTQGVTTDIDGKYILIM